MLPISKSACLQTHDSHCSSSILNGLELPVMPNVYCSPRDDIVAESLCFSGFREPGPPRRSRRRASKRRQSHEYRRDLSGFSPAGGPEKTCMVGAGARGAGREARGAVTASERSRCVLALHRTACYNRPRAREADLASAVGTLSRLDGKHICTSCRPVDQKSGRRRPLFSRKWATVRFRARPEAPIERTPTRRPA